MKAPPSKPATRFCCGALQLSVVGSDCAIEVLGASLVESAFLFTVLLITYRIVFGVFRDLHRRRIDFSLAPLINLGSTSKLSQT
jgi:hypothetical protein